MFFIKKQKKNIETSYNKNVNKKFEWNHRRKFVSRYFFQLIYSNQTFSKRSKQQRFSQRWIYCAYFSTFVWNHVVSKRFWFQNRHFSNDHRNSWKIERKNCIWSLSFVTFRIFFWTIIHRESNVSIKLFAKNRKNIFDKIDDDHLNQRIKHSTRNELIS